MKEAKFIARARQDLDERFRKKWRRAAKDTRPPHGWIREIREALGMSTRQLARLAKMNVSTVSNLEHSERRGTVKLASLRKLAKALHCELVYALVPSKTLERILRDRAHAQLLLEILAPARKAGVDLPARLVTDMANSIIRDRKMLEKPHALWEEAQFPKGVTPQDVLAAMAPKTAPAPSAPAAPSGESAEEQALRATVLAEAQRLLRELGAMREKGKVEE